MIPVEKFILRSTIKKRFCEKCGTKKRLTYHHKKPKSKGGTDDPSNIQILCRDCHNKIHGIKPIKKPNKKYSKIRKGKWKTKPL